MLQALSRQSIRRPRLALLIAFLAALPAVLGLARLELRTDGRALVPDDAPALAVDEELRRTFEVEDPIVVLVESENGAYDLRALQAVRELTTALLELPGRGTVTSLATEATSRVAEDELRFLTFLEPFPRTPDEAELVRDEVEALDVYDGTLVALDGSASAIYVGVPEEADRAALVRDVRRVVGGHEEALRCQAPEVRLSVLGAPTAEVLLGVHLLRDLGVPSWLTGDPVDADAGAWRGLILAVLGVVVVVFWVAFRSPLAALPPLIEVGTCTAMTFGLMGWCGVPVYLVTAILPVILVALGIADEIHVFERFRQLAAGAGATDTRELVERALGDKRASVTKTSLTTAVGFLSFALSPIAAVRAFGVFAAVGILLCLLWTLTAVPALLVLLGPERLLGRRGAGGATSSALARLAAGWVGLVVRRPLPFVVGGLLVAGGALLLARRVVVQDGWVSGFAPESELRRATETFERRFFGTHRLLVCVDAGHEALRGTLQPDDVSHAGVFLTVGERDPADLVGARLRLSPSTPSERKGDLVERVCVVADAAREPGMEDGRVVVRLERAGVAEMMRRYWGGGAMDWEITPQRMKRADTLERVAGLERLLAELPAEHGDGESAVGGVLGPARYLATTSFIYAGRAPGSRAVPSDSGEIERAWHNYGAIRGERRLRQVVDPTYSRALLDVYLRDASYVGTARLLDRLHEHEAEELLPHGLSLSFSGDVATSQALIEAVVTTQVRSVLVSLVGILALVSVLGRSLRRGLLAVLPAALSVLFNLAGMGALGVPLGVATSMFAAMTLGIGVDYAIHFLEWARREAARGPAAALVEAARVTGPALLVDALAVGLGFGVLTLSQVPANARLGALLVASVAGCLVVTLTLLPALAVRWGGLGVSPSLERDDRP